MYRYVGVYFIIYVVIAQLSIQTVALSVFTPFWRQRERVFSVSSSQSGDPRFESHSHHFLDLFVGSPEFKSSPTLVNSQVVHLRPGWILNNVMFSLNYLFQLFARLHQHLCYKQ